MPDLPPYTVVSEGDLHTVMHGPVPVAYFNGSFALGLALQTSDKLNAKQDGDDA